MALAEPRIGTGPELQRCRVLFVAEAVTLAHVARAAALARALDPAAYEISFAAAPRYRHLMGTDRFRHLEIFSIEPRAFLHALARGAPPYAAAMLRRYVSEDLRVLEAVKPEVVVGDFRLSLSVSARLAKVPYIAIANAYWSPYAKQRYVVPALPITRILPIALAQVLFDAARPAAFAYHARALNAVRREYGMDSLGPDLRRGYTDGDLTLYADLPGCVEMQALPPSHRFIGPVLWSPQVDLPPWWQDLPTEQPVVYVTLGSSGNARHLAPILRGLAGLPLTVIAAGAGAAPAPRRGDSVYVADYLPGELAAARASLVICNGGSPACYQALAAGVPVIGVAGNLDQYLNMQTLERLGAGRLLRSDRLGPGRIAAAATQMLGDGGTRAAARRQAEAIRRHDYRSAFTAAMAGVRGAGARVGV